jgi:hypothetical protein
LNYSAGRGTNGGDRGDGGTINVFLDEDDSHLLLASSWDTTGGKVGPADRHGNPGRGRRGGRGGAGCKWSVALQSSTHFLLRSQQGLNLWIASTTVQTIVLAGVRNLLCRELSLPLGLKLGVEPMSVSTLPIIV